MKELSAHRLVKQLENLKTEWQIYRDNLSTDSVEVAIVNQYLNDIDLMLERLRGMNENREA